MQSTTYQPLLLVKGPKPGAMPKKGFSFDKRDFAARPLFGIDGGKKAIPGNNQWYVAEAQQDSVEGENPWDVAYRALGEGLGFPGSDRPIAVEPDLMQAWTFENPTPLTGARLGFGADNTCEFNDQDSNGDELPRGPEFAWYLRDEFSGLRTARETVGNKLQSVRVAHLDTGYDPAHVTCPASVLADRAKPELQRLQRNFVEPDNLRDAADPGLRGVLRFPGHGTSTLGVLAGNVLENVPESGPLAGLPLGGAPNAEIVAIRVADTVAHFRTSAIARAVEYAARVGCQVLSMSMGGVPSSAWADAVDFAYLSGVVMCCAAGNNFGGLPIRHIVYPARFPRVVAVCGVMADGRPYNRLPRRIMQGNWGPKRKMKSSTLSAYTPNMPWAELGCKNIVDMDGGGTSAATPQVAAAAALWLAQHDPQYTEPWMRVEAVRRALFDSAAPVDEVKRLGLGTLQAHLALAEKPAPQASLKQSKVGRGRFALMRLLTRFGISGERRRAEMFEAEASQLLQSCKALEDIVERHDLDPEEGAERTPAAMREIVEALAAEPRASVTLRDYLKDHFSATIRPQVPVGGMDAIEEIPATPVVPTPRTRRLRSFALDPGLGTQLETYTLNQRELDVRWETLQPGPVGEYLEVVDVDPPSRAAYEPVDLNDPNVLATAGLAPTLGDPRFHQQMVYAVAMRTIDVFEKALGRPAMWAPRLTKHNGKWHEDFVRRLRIYPHALRDKNAFYSPEQSALLFGYFRARATDVGNNLPGGTVFTCLSHDVIAHETTHALLDGIHPRFREATNPDVFAFHEGFSDVVALFQHFDDRAVLRHQIAKTRGDLSQENLLAQLARQFGEASGRRGALRDAIGQFDRESGKWKPHQPRVDDYESQSESHHRGAVLVAAIFDAFCGIYRSRTRDLFRLATGGTGVLREGDIPPDLVDRLAEEAMTAAQHVLRVAIRALDYCPPVDITFGDYLRALITADSDLVPDDHYGYRVAFIEAFRKRGIYPRGLRNLSVESLRWRRAHDLGTEEMLTDILGEVGSDWSGNPSREQEFLAIRKHKAYVHSWTIKLLESLSANECRAMGLAWGGGANAVVNLRRNNATLPSVEIHSLRPTQRLVPGGKFRQEAIVEITQARDEPLDPANPALGTFIFRGGCTLIVDPAQPVIRYCVSRDILDEHRLAAQRKFERERRFRKTHAAAAGLSPFAMLHRGN